MCVYMYYVKVHALRKEQNIRRRRGQPLAVSRKKKLHVLYIHVCTHSEGLWNRWKMEEGTGKYIF